MRYFMRDGKAFWFLAIGFLAGIAGSFCAVGVWPNTPLHAVATDKMESFGIATGHAEENYEIVYFLDYLTGDLKAFVVGRLANGNFGILATAGANVLKDMEIDAGKNPKLLMVTGLSDLTRNGRGSNILPSRSVLYVADVTTGKCAVYAMPCNATAHNRGVPVPTTPMVLITGFPFRQATPKGKGADE